MQLRFLRDLTITITGPVTAPQWSQDSAAPATPFATGEYTFKAGEVRRATRINARTFSVSGVGRFEAEEGVDVEVIDT